MLDSEKNQAMTAPTQTRSIEERRALLQRATSSHAHDPRVMPALMATYSPDHIRDAAQRGLYIGYSRANEIIALELTTDLRELRLPAWMDTLDVTEGEDWRIAVEQAQKRCGVMLMLLSPEALSDEELLAEMHNFQSSGKIIIPAIQEPCDISALTLYVEAIDFHVNYRAGLRALLQLLRRPSQATA